MTYTVQIDGVIVYRTKNAQEFDNYCKSIYEQTRMKANVVYSCIPLS